MVEFAISMDSIDLFPVYTKVSNYLEMFFIFISHFTRSGYKFQVCLISRFQKKCVTNDPHCLCILNSSFVSSLF